MLATGNAGEFWGWLILASYRPPDLLCIGTAIEDFKLHDAFGVILRGIRGSIP